VELLKDFNDFCSKLRSKVKGINHTSKDGFNLYHKNDKQKSHNSIPTRYQNFEGILGEMKQKISELSSDDLPYIKHNLSYSERTALDELTNNKDIIIHRADKGSTITVQDRTQYITEGQEHLSDTTTYTPLTGDPTEHICKEIKSLLSDYRKKGYLTDNMTKFCMPPENAKLARLYFLKKKKIHKSPPGIRPIVSSCGSPTEHISEFVDYWLQPHMQSLPSFIKDTTQLINELQNIHVNASDWLVCIDVKSLYTNIPHSEGLKACLQAFKYWEEINPQQPPAEILCNLLEVVLKNNMFEFNNKQYKQLYGTAMGTRTAPSYANTFMGSLEQTILESTQKKPKYYRRYIDDILMIWEYSEEDLDRFIESMNSFHHSIKFTVEKSLEKVTFLDINILKDETFLSTNKLSVETHIKKTNKLAYVHRSSYHPTSTGKGIAIGEAKRYLRTNSNELTFKSFIDKHINHLSQRGYPKNQTSKLVSTITFNQRPTTLQQKNKKKTNRPVFVSRYSPMAKKALNVIRKHWHYLQKDKTLGHLFHEPPLMAYRMNKNLHKKLVRAKLPPSTSKTTVPPQKIKTPLEHIPVFEPESSHSITWHENITHFCAIRSCFLHKILNTSLRIRSSITFRSYRIRGRTNCNTKNIVYAITCTKYKKQYVGQTTNSLRHRISQHIAKSKPFSKQKPSAVDTHFAQPGHKMSVQPLAVVPNNHCNIQSRLHTLEALWIERLKSVYPQGLNWSHGTRK